MPIHNTMGVVFSNYLGVQKKGEVFGEAFAFETKMFLGGSSNYCKGVDQDVNIQMENFWSLTWYDNFRLC